MKKILRLTGIAALAGAGYWFVTEKLLRPAQKPASAPAAFRPRPSGESPVDGADDLNHINGIGPVYAARLAEAGIDSFRALADAPLATVSEAADISETKAADWIEQARQLAG